MKKEKEIMDVVFILDRSGSMMGTETDTIGGYNNYIKSYKDKNAKITTVLFDHMYEMITKRKDVKEVEIANKKIEIKSNESLDKKSLKDINHQIFLSSKELFLILDQI